MTTTTTMATITTMGTTMATIMIRGTDMEPTVTVTVTAIITMPRRPSASPSPWGSGSTPSMW